VPFFLIPRLTTLKGTLINKSLDRTRTMKFAHIGVWLVFAGALAGISPVTAQTNQAASADDYVGQIRQEMPWEFGPFVQGGVGVGDRSDFSFFTLGIHGGKVLTDPMGPGLLKGQFEYAGELMPFWQSYTPDPHVVTNITTVGGRTFTSQYSVAGGTFTGISMTPIILRWNFHGTRRIQPWFQGAGGLIWTNHKYPPDILVPKGQPGGTSVFNFSPQGGIGVHFFVSPKRSWDFAANAVHISSASLGDKNPGVNASMQFQVGYTWWK
jgi:lipid A 3-O-deacylase